MHDPPADLPDFDAIPGQRRQWSDAISRWFGEAIDRQSDALAGQPCQYVDRLASDPAGPWIEQDITWNAFPGTLRRRWGRAKALALADDPVPLRRWAGATGAVPAGAAAAGAFYRPQDEYCEWRVERDAGGRITRVTFTSEPPEYWQAFHGDDLPAEDPSAPPSSFRGDPQLLLERYREYVDPSVQLVDLVRDGRYDPYNRWNTVDGIMHLTHPSNTLRAEITLGADASVLRTRDGRLTADPDALIVGAGYGGNDRCSDPTIGASVNHLAALGYAVTLQDPVGLYMDHLDMTGWTIPDGGPVEPGWFRIVRGRPGFIARAVFEVPADVGLTVGDLRIGGEPIRYGGQLAERLTIKIVGLAAVGAGFANRPAGLPYRACADAANPSIVFSVPADEACPQGSLPIFGYAEAITSARITDRLVPARPLPPRRRWSRAP